MLTKDEEDLDRGRDVSLSKPSKCYHVGYEIVGRNPVPLRCLLFTSGYGFTFNQSFN